MKEYDERLDQLIENISDLQSIREGIAHPISLLTHYIKYFDDDREVIKEDLVELNRKLEIVYKLTSERLKKQINQWSEKEANFG